MSQIFTNLRRLAGRKLSVNQKLWLKRLGRGEHPWQGKGARPHAFFHSKKSSEIVTRGFNALAEARSNLAVVTAQLETGHVNYVELPSRIPSTPRLVVKQADSLATVEALIRLLDSPGWNIDIEGKHGSHISHKVAHKHPDKIWAIRVYHRLVALNGRQLSTESEVVTIEPWEELGADIERPDGSTYDAGTLRRVIPKSNLPLKYISPRLWEQALSENNELEWQAPHLYEVTEPVDIVYTWVDGDDKQWRERQIAALRAIDPDAVNETALSDSRFQSHDELKYSLRSVEAYAGWVNHIFIVTDHQVPSWLNTNHPKISVIDHSEIFTNQEVLPVFNSHAIESQLHHIPALSEQYLYMNDDLFFMKPVAPDVFFTSNGLSKFFPSTAPLDIETPSAKDLPVTSAAKHGRQFMIDVHHRTVTHKFKHTPHPQLKSVLSRMEHDHASLFETVAKSKFRHPNDYSIASALYHFHAYAQRKAVPGTIRYGYVDIGNPEAELTLDWLVHRNDLQVICLNDTHIDPDNKPAVAEKLNYYLSSRFPTPSSFELSSPTAAQR